MIPDQRAEQRTAQRRTVATLVSSQVVSGVGMASGLSVGALLAEELSGSESLAGLGTTAQVLGGALIAIPTARIMAARGRRPGLEFGYALATLGAVVVIASALLGSFWLMLVGMLLFGGGTAGSGQARYAAADLASDAHRGRDLSLVVWATTLGSALGPNLIGPGRDLARVVGIPDLAGSFVFALAGFVLAVVVINRFLRPDPLLLSRELAAPAASGPVTYDGSLGRGLRVLRANPRARLGMLTTALGHAVMVSVMVMTPIHMKQGHADLGLIGALLSLHIVGMYAFSPLVGMAVDRWGGRPVAVAGGVVLAVAGALASLAPTGWSLVLLGALFLLGIGWSLTLVSGSTMLTQAVDPDERPAVQGATEVFMGLAAAGGGAIAGVVVGASGLGVLAQGAAVVALLIALLAATQRGR